MNHEQLNSNLFSTLYLASCSVSGLEELWHWGWDPQKNVNCITFQQLEPACTQQRISLEHYSSVSTWHSGSLLRTHSSKLFCFHTSSTWSLDLANTLKMIIIHQKILQIKKIYTITRLTLRFARLPRFRTQSRESVSLGCRHFSKIFIHWKFNTSESRIDPDWRETGTNYSVTDFYLVK